MCLVIILNYYLMLTILMGIHVKMIHKITQKTATFTHNLLAHHYRLSDVSHGQVSFLCLSLSMMLSYNFSELILTFKIMVPSVQVQD